MCYSKEVQLITALIIFIFCIIYYFKYKTKYESLKEKKWVFPFIKSILIGYALIGGHQLFEFLSLVTDSQIIYKIGLLMSITFTYVILRSLEILLNKDFKSKYSIPIIFAVGLHMFMVDMSFEPFSFYLKHNSAFIWSAAHLSIYFYMHVCALKEVKNFKHTNSKKTLTYFLLAAGDFTLLLATIYSISGFFIFGNNVCTDSPSIWCTFYALQVLIFPIFVVMIPSFLDRPKKNISLKTKNAIKYYFYALLIVTLMALTLPLFNCLTWKFVFP